MKNKIKIVILLILIVALVSTFQETYSRYVSNATGNVTANIARWQVVVNNTDITSASSSNVTLTPTFTANSNVKSGTIAPGSSGYFDVVINPANVDVSFTYTITLTADANAPSSFSITSYGISNGTSYNASGATTHTYTTNEARVVTQNKLYSSAFSAFTVRVWFEWDDLNTTAGNTADTTVGLNSANGTNTNTTINVNLAFQQYMG